jgi:signal transduction histidine kinase
MAYSIWISKINITVMRLSYQQKLVVLFSIIVLGTITGALTTYFNHQSVKTSNNWVEHTIAVLYESERTLSLTQDIILVGQGYALTGDSNYLSPFNSALFLLHSSVTNLRDLVKDNMTQTERLDTLQKLIFNRVNLTKKNVTANRRAFPATQLFVNSYRNMRTIRSLTQRIQTEEENLLKKRQAASIVSYSTFINSFYTLICFTILLLFIALFTVKHNFKEEKKYRESSILESKSKEMEQFTYITSHELRHPLLTIQNYIKIFNEDHSNQLDKEGLRYLTSISGAAKQMEILIMGLFEYSRLSKTKQLEKVNCNEAIEAVLLDLHLIIQSTNAKITVNHLPILQASPSELKQLFQSLITNALKFKKCNERPQLTISATKMADSYQFEFCDNGIGIEEKDSKKIFNIFKRLHPAEEYEGTGLGLAYCKKIVELHHGQIWVKSRPSQGSSFYFTIKI